MLTERESHGAEKKAEREREREMEREGEEETSDESRDDSRTGSIYIQRLEILIDTENDRDECG